MRLKNAMLMAAMGMMGLGVMAAVAEVAASMPGAATQAGQKLVIVKGMYGDLPGGEKVDVTEKLKALVKGDALSVEAINDNFEDPASGIIKKLEVEYTVGGVKKKRVVPERAMLTIAVGDPEPKKLLVKKAVWGELAKGKVADVTELVKGVQVGETVNLEVSTDVLNPPEGAEKLELKVEYTVNGVEKTVVVGDAGVLELKGE